MAAENNDATHTPVRPQESRPEPAFTGREVHSLYEDMASLKQDRPGTTGDTKPGDSQTQTLDFNTNSLFERNSQFYKNDSQMMQSQTELLSPDKSLSTAELTERMSTGTTHARKGEDISGLAQRKLGENASSEQREAFIKALQSINGLEPGAQLSKGQELKLPGVNENGDFVHSQNGVDRLWSPADGRTETRTADGTKTTNFRDGSSRIEQPNGDKFDIAGDTTTLTKADGTRITSRPSGEVTNTVDGLRIDRGPDGKLKTVDGPPLQGTHERTSDGQGGTVDRSRGTRPEENFALVQSKDGRMEVFDRGPDGKERVSSLMREPGVEAARRETMERAERLFSNPEDLAKFKADMVRFEGRAQERGMEPSKVADTYKAVNRMLDGGPNAKLDQGDRNLLARQVMSHAATPTSVDQGIHNTCTVTALESNLYTKNPDKAAGLVADVALTGQFKAADGKVLTVPPGSMKPDHEAAVPKPGDGQRDFASQLFQVTAVNLLYQSKYTLPWTYEQERVPASDRQSDQGERDRIFGITYGKEFGGLTGDDVQKINERITGNQDPDLILPGAHNPDQMHEDLERLHREGRLPTTISVHTGNPPFNHGDRGGWHRLSITGYDPVKREIQMDNQWGSLDDRIKRPVPLNELFLARRTPKEAATYRTENPSYFDRPK